MQVLLCKKKTDITKVEKDSCLGALERFISGERTQSTSWCDWDIPLHWGGLSDPFQPCEEKHRVSYESLKLLAETGYPFIVSTKGKLLATDEYLALLKKCNAVVQISMLCSKYDCMERGAPTYEERLEMCKKISPNCKRLIVRLQPYLTEVLYDVLENMPRLKQAGVYGVTVEGMKFARGLKGFVKVGADYAYPKERLISHFEKIREASHNSGLKFFCAENRLRGMGDSMCCCGAEGVEGFKTNKFNIEHLVLRNAEKPSRKMKEKGTASCFGRLDQTAGSSRFYKANSFYDVMTSKKIFSSYEPVVRGGNRKYISNKEKLKFTRWLRSTGITRKEVDEITGTQMSSHYFCVKEDGQIAIPTEEAFEKLKKSPKIKDVPEEISDLIQRKNKSAESDYRKFRAYVDSLEVGTEEAI